jgi:plasmid segregation protein ParM
MQLIFLVTYGAEKVFCFSFLFKIGCAMSIIRALEVGFGTTSLTVGIDSKGHPVVKTFPSFVAQVDPSKIGLNAGLNKRDTVTVNVKGQNYEVGPDAHLASDKTSSRVLNSAYIESEQYQALLFGSLTFMGSRSIDLLVLALPVQNWARRDELKQLVVGTHVINGNSYTVKDAWVIVQPMGGLLCHANQIGQVAFNELLEQNILSVDPGFGTFDYVYSTGLKLNDSRSDGNELGMSAVLNECAKSLRGVFPSLTDFPLEKIDDAFYKNDGFIRISGKKYPFPVCEGKLVDGKPTNVKFDLRSSIDSVTKSAITKLKNVVGNGGDIDLIILMGGPHKVYLPALKHAYPDHEIIILKEAIVSVCRGMHYGGVQYYKALQRSKRN